MTNGIQRTVIGIKPDAFCPNSPREAGSELKIALPINPQEFIDEVKKLLLESGIDVICEHSKICSEELARTHYAEFAGVFSEKHGEYQQDFLASYMNSGKSYWLLCEGEDAIKRGREAIRFIRDKYLISPKLARYNMTHGSGNVEEALREEKLHFKD